MQIAPPFLENSNLEPKIILHRRMVKEGNLSNTKAIVKWKWCLRRLMPYGKQTDH